MRRSFKMKLVLLSSFAILFGVQICQISANHRSERQASNYEFPGNAVRKAQYEELIEQYDPVARVAAAQTYSPSVTDPQDYSGQSYSQPAYRASSGSAASRSRAPQYQSSNSKAEEEAKRLAEEEEEKKPDRLALLLQESKFTCGDKKDGYYADESVGCQVFHYCVAGAKHSWQCPENTVFHQIHLNCVPAAQDICTQSSKFHVVNDYLYKPLEQRGPNNTIRYHQRYYPEGFDFGGDVLSQVLPPSQPQRPASSPYNSRDSYDEDSYEPRGNSRSQPDNYPSYQSYPASTPVRAQPVSRPIYKQPVVRQPAPQTYSAPSYTTQSQPKPTSRPSTYSTPSLYASTSYSDDSDAYDTYPSSGSSYNSRDSSDYSSSGNSYSSPSASYPSSQYSGSSGSSSSYPSSSAGSSAALSSYRPIQAAKPASYPSRSIGIPIASFRVAAAPAPTNYGSSAQASRVRASAYPSPTGFSLGAFNSEMASGVKYDEEY
ncbi:unnamed protein product [Oppiella nova]|uniref:Chitin-binding type-2 domain-containing protein n=1 Tax=Oppiella nova TaxID=334625 RepID=A0A7R9LDG3_9ACAR|nr:unnamed protein product [Oppiella nova]CAG2162455.1 unnamed protein product [Oppiella nova]